MTGTTLACQRDYRAAYGWANPVGVPSNAPGVGRADPSSVDEVLAWAEMPLATAEVAAVCHREIPDVRAELARVARFEPVGGDGYWSAM